MGRETGRLKEMQRERETLKGINRTKRHNERDLQKERLPGNTRGLWVGPVAKAVVGASCARASGPCDFATCTGNGCGV